MHVDLKPAQDDLMDAADHRHPQEMQEFLFEFFMDMASPVVEGSFGVVL